MSGTVATDGCLNGYSHLKPRRTTFGKQPWFFELFLCVCLVLVDSIILNIILSKIFVSILILLFWWLNGSLATETKVFGSVKMYLKNAVQKLCSKACVKCIVVNVIKNVFCFCCCCMCSSYKEYCNTLLPLLYSLNVYSVKHMHTCAEVICMCFVLSDCCRWWNPSSRLPLSGAPSQQQRRRM